MECLAAVCSHGMGSIAPGKQPTFTDRGIGQFAFAFGLECGLVLATALAIGC